jgi:uncharacterized membrane protein YhaH (DUF805 family)
VPFEISDLWEWDGRIDRKTYFLAGFFGCAIKFNLDRLIAIYLFHRAINFVDYWRPLGTAAPLKNLTLADKEWLGVLVVTALPFIYVGLTMTLRRLRDLDYPLWLTALFFVPAVNLLFFLVLCVLPSGADNTRHNAFSRKPALAFGALMPRSKLGSATVATIVTGSLGLCAVVGLSTMAGSYGWSLFLSIPFCMGLFSTLLYGAREPRTSRESIGVALLSVTIAGVALLAVAAEGVICLAMAAPIAYAVAALGGMIGHSVVVLGWMARHDSHRPTASLCLAVLLVPMSSAVEHVAHHAAPMYQVQSSIEIAAPPSAVWPKVIAFSAIPPPQEIIFRTGIAYPIRAEITGRGAGAVRRCMFSTGPFVEPIEVWDEPKLLRFGVTENPAPLNELSPYGNIQPRHLHGYFVSHQGQFLLTELPGGRTRLDGTTWYTDAMWPAVYWRIWSDYIIHRIHMRVLAHIKLEAEVPPGR